MLQVGTIVADRYELLEQIGAGGMAVVFRAMDHKLDREVSVKVIREDFIDDPVQVENFQKEARAVAMLTHPNVAGVYDIGTEQGLQYMVKEYVDGITLKEYIRRRRHMSSDEIVKVSLKIAEALKAAHEAHIIHRDIKPQNVLVSPRGEVKVTDFGIAKFMKSGTVTSHKEAMGSVHYLSPEQARGQQVDERSDLYSLGITMYEMAVGEPPFDGETPVAVAMKQLHEPLPNPSEKVEDLWPGLEAIILKLTEKAPVDRYQNVDTLITDLKRVYRDPSHAAAGLIATGGLTAAGRTGGKKGRRAENDEDDREGLTFWQKYGVAILSVILGIMLLILGLVAAEAFKNRGTQNNSSQTVMVSLPNFQGMTLEEARQNAEQEGLRIRFVEKARAYSSNYEAGTIIFQEPKSGTPVETGRTFEVSLTISKGVQEITKVPDYLNSKYEDAVQELANRGLVYTIETRETEKEEENGKILSQTPSAGSEMRDSTVIRLVVGVLKEQIARVPNLYGMNEEQAARELLAEGLELGEVSEAASSTVPAGKVIAQGMPQGTELPKGAKVDITISTGKPDESGQTAAGGRFLLSVDFFGTSEAQTGRLTVVADTDLGPQNLVDQVFSRTELTEKDTWIDYPVGTYRIRVLFNGEEQFRLDVE